MFKWSDKSEGLLLTCDNRLIKLMNRVLELSPVDMTIIEGHRSNEVQAEMLRTGKSKLGPGKSKHNHSPSRAVDYAPLKNGGIDWNDREFWLQHVGFIKGVAAGMGIRIRCGADWDGDMETRDQSFHDLPHIELL